MSDVFRGNLIFRTWLRDPNSLGANSQWYLSSPLPHDIPPHVDTDNYPGWGYWGLGRGPLRNPQDYIAPSNMALLTAPPPVEMPHNQYDWPNPRGRPPIPQDLHASFPLPLQQTLPENQYDWPVPKGRAPLNLGMVDYLLPWSQAPPNNQIDWPVPRGPRRNPQDWDDSFKLPLQQNLPPGARYDSLPVLAKRNPQDWIADSNIALLTAVAPPFFETDWPVPRGPQRGRQDWVLPQPYVLNAAVYDLGFNLWGLPERVRRNPQDWILPQPYVLNTVVAQPPINQTDWPVPRGPRRAPQDWEDSFKLPLQQTLPKNQYSWPNPVLARKPVVADWILSVPSTLTFVQPPLNQRDWPNPSAYLRRIGVPPTWTDSFKLPIQGRMPPRQLDWPNPKGPRQPGVSVLAYILITQPSPPIPPFYDDRLTLKNEVRRTRDLVNKTGRVRFLKNEIRR